MSLALPAAAAQPSSVCKGKPTQDLADGSTWCLLHEGKTEVTTTLSRDDGNSKSKTNPANIFIVAMSGPYVDGMRKTEKRMLAICSAMQEQSPEAFAGNARSQIVVSMLWPEKAIAEGVGNIDHRYRNQAAYMSTKCRNLRHFGTRLR